MDTYVSMRIFFREGDKQRWQGALERAAERMVRIDSLCDNYRPDSEVSRINGRAGEGWVKVSPEVSDLVQRSLQISDLAHGRFDITVGPLMQGYGFGRKENLDILRPEEIAPLLQKIDYHLVQVAGDRVALQKTGMAIDLGGVAKGYAIDAAIRELTASGVTDAQVDVGGEVSTLCSPLTAGKRHIYIRNPQQRDKFYGRFRMDQGCVATSGDYERFFMFDGKRYHHILNPKTGLPAWGCRSVTIKANDNTLCDGLSTAVFVLGPEQGMELVERLADVEAIILFEKEGRLQHRVSSGLQSAFEVLSR